MKRNKSNPTFLIRFWWTLPAQWILKAALVRKTALHGSHLMVSLAWHSSAWVCRSLKLPPLNVQNLHWNTRILIVFSRISSCEYQIKIDLELYSMTYSIFFLEFDTHWINDWPRKKSIGHIKPKHVHNLKNRHTMFQKQGRQFISSVKT